MPQDGEPQPAGGAGEQQDLAVRNRPDHRRAPARARHHRVDLLLDEAVERGGGARDQCDSDRRAKQQPRGRKLLHREQHPDHGREDDERDDARLGEAPELHTYTRDRSGSDL